MPFNKFIKNVLVKRAPASLINSVVVFFNSKEQITAFNCHKPEDCNYYNNYQGSGSDWGNLCHRWLWRWLIEPSATLE